MQGLAHRAGPFLDHISMKIYFWLITLLLFLSSPNSISQEVYSNFDDFKDAVTSATAGDEIVLAEGRYVGESITLTGINGTEAEPIIIRAEEIGKDTLDEGTYFDFRNCSYITVQGFVINISEKSTTFKLQASNNIRLTQNVFNGIDEEYYKDDGVSRNSSVWISIQGLWDDDVTLSHNNRIEHNRFMNKHTLGNMIKIDGTNELYVSQYDVIENNHFMNMGPRATNEMEVIRIGWSAMSESDGFTLVQNNLFEDCNGDPEIISVKCNKNTIAHNTFRRCMGTLSLRHGNESTVEGNFFFGEGVEGTGGVRFYGSDHVIINNYFQDLTGTKWDAPITLTYGDADEGSTGLTKHFRIERALIANNTLVNNNHGIEVGYDNTGKYTKPPRDVVLVNNAIVCDTNAVVKYINAPDNMQWVDNIANLSGEGVLGDGISFTSAEFMNDDLLLSFVDSLGYFKTTTNSPTYNSIEDYNDIVVSDIDGQLRQATTNYGADEFNSSAILYTPLTAADVGPSLGDYLYASVSNASIGVGGGEISISILGNVDWQLQSNESWIDVDPLSGNGYAGVTIQVQENTTGIVRTGQVLLSSIGAETNIEKIIRVTQSDSEPLIFSLSDTELLFDADAQEKIISITSNTTWALGAGASWLWNTPDEGANSEDVTVGVDENTSVEPRKATLVVNYSESLKDSVVICQSGRVGDEIKLPIIAAVASTEQDDGGNIASNVYDGNFDNRWSGQGDGAEITLELDKQYRISYIKVGLFKANERQTYFDVLTSIDNEHYTEARMDISSELSDDVLTIYDLPDTTAKYLRIVGHGNSTGDWNSFTELEVWGWQTTSTTKPEKLLEMNPTVYPNPTTVKNITLSCEEGTEVKIVDATGVVKYLGTTTARDQKLDIELDCGVYYVIFRYNNKRSISTLVVE